MTTEQSQIQPEAGSHAARNLLLAVSLSTLAVTSTAACSGDSAPDRYKTLVSQGVKDSYVVAASGTGNTMDPQALNPQQPYGGDFEAVCKGKGSAAFSLMNRSKLIGKFVIPCGDGGAANYSVKAPVTSVDISGARKDTKWSVLVKPNASAKP